MNSAAPPTPIVRTASIEDLKFVIALQKKFSNQLGFVPRQGLEWYLQAGRVSFVFENDCPAGYILGRDSFRWCIAMRPITQAAIAFDAQRRRHGLALVAAEETAAREAGQVALQAMCRSDLEANDFWIAAGFEEIGRYNPKTARRKTMICWRKRLITAVPTWYRHLPPVAGHKARSIHATR
jgi:N-acetylglutamate synthase-like GNAT family acetyltransferase